MWTAPSRTRPSIVRAVGPIARAVGWIALLVVLAASGAGLAGLAWHAPGSAAREELTYTGDAALGARLATAQASLQDIASDVQQLATEAKSALEEVTSADPTRLQDGLARGDAIAASIDDKARALHASLADLQGDEPDAAVRYSNPTLVRRAAILAAVEAATGLAGSWQAVANRAGDTSTLTALISEHDATVLEGTQHGVDSKFKAAVTSIKDALAVMARIEALRNRLLAPGDSVLDEWIQRTKAYDLALQHLYAALVKSKGDVTIEVQSARREEREAFDQLPPDRRTILVIISEVTRNGLTQAVLAIDDASGRLDDALADVSASPSPSG
ncbi:MAG TPA: hypothetical protein VHR16_08110 [Candidatus Limnocylindrales bacterium]|nr:hypothetical protein [Candidatus Limnocylindrales bacterium]